MDKDLTEKLQLLFATYHKSLPAKIADIEGKWQKLQIEWNEQLFQDFLRAAHTLHGSAGTYGYTTVSEAAAQLELYLKSLVNKTPTTEDLSTISGLFTVLKTTVSTLAVAQSTQQQHDAIPKKTLTSPVEEKEIYLLETESKVAKDITVQLCYYHHKIKQFNNFGDLLEAIIQKIPAVCVLDIQVLSDEEINTLNVLISQQKKPLPLLFISNNGDLEVRLKAIRAGGCGFFVKPFDYVRLAAKLDEISGSQAIKPYRILVVEDSEALTDYFALLLQQAGMVTAVVNNPLQIIATLIDFDPDLILMDIYMPKCSGLELAAILRQQSAYASIPIIFLSAEDDKTKQLAAMRLGGDGFLTKPIQTDYLISVVNARAERYRVLRSFMVRDSLTGLLNHTNIQHQLDLELDRAKRLDIPMSFIMIDIDYFKNVNDTYGHLVGDRVIQSLCNLLTKQLRKTDLIGRYGGEEFAAVLLNIDKHNAMALCDELREDFSQLQHVAGERKFSVKFSAGIADFPDFNNATEMTAAADKALYQAKQQGRNRVVIADGKK